MSHYSIYQHGNGISLDKLSKEDLNDLLELKKESWSTTHRISLINMADQLAWYESLSKEDIHTPKNLVLVASTETRPSSWEFERVGIFKFFDIDWHSMKANVAWDIYACHRKKGLGKKLVEAGVGFAKNVLGIRKLNAEILENNPASMKCALAAGFEQEGVKRQEVWRQGRFLNSHMMGLIISHLQSPTSFS